MSEINPIDPVLYKQEVMRLCQNNRLADAIIVCQKLCRENDDDAESWFLLGAVNGAMGNFPEAEDCCRRSIAIHPGMPVTHYNLGIAVLNQRRAADSIESFEAAIKLNPAYFEAFCDLGNAHKALRNFDTAIKLYRKSIELNPSNALAYLCLSTIYYDRGELDLALDCYRKVVDLTGSDGAKIRLATAIPVIAASTAQIDEIRNRLLDNIDLLMNQDMQVRDPVREIGFTNFFLAYHGRNDREIQMKLAALYMKVCPLINYTAPHCQEERSRAGKDKIRIGFISKYLMDHSIGKSSRGIIEHLSRDVFDVVVFFLATPDDATGLLIQQCADHTVVLPNNISAAQARIAEEEIDILFYQDTGMDIFTFFLAFARLAPVQCTSFGHPETTGIETLDYYISTDAWEPEDGDGHYSEKLVRLKNVPSVAYYYKPDVPSSLKSRNEYGLEREDHIYICPQALFKFHPEFDEVLSAILRRDSNGILVLIEGSHHHWTELLLNRFRRTMPDVLDRVRFVPQQRGPDFINLVAISDVMLDTIHFCGFNTTLEGFAAGTPVVTMPGEFMRSRHTMSFYEKMDIHDCVAGSLEEYVDIAVRLGTDIEYREQLSRNILDRQSVLWEDIEVVREFERFFIHAANGKTGVQVVQQQY